MLRLHKEKCKKKKGVFSFACQTLRQGDRTLVTYSTSSNLYYEVSKTKCKSDPSPTLIQILRVGHCDTQLMALRLLGAVKLLPKKTVQQGGTIKRVPVKH